MNTAFVRGPIIKDEERARGWTVECYISEYLGYGANVGVYPPYEDVYSFPKLIALNRFKRIYTYH